MLSDKQRIEAALEVLHRGNIVEIRCLKVGEWGSTWSGYFDDYSLAADAALEAEAEGCGGIYTLLNKVHPGCFARSPNRMTKRNPKASTETDIEARQWALVDFDPVRPSGISSTVAELDKAKKASKIVFDLAAESVGAENLVRACSGNGWHVLIPIDSNAKDAYIKEMLGIFARHVDHIEGVDVDLSVTKANGLTKLYGTTATKGYSTPDRPHRTSYILTPNLEPNNV